MSEVHDAAEPRDRSVVRSVDRAVSIMEILARDGWSGVTEIARELEVHKSTVFRLVSTLEERGIVEQHPGTQKYRLGFAMARLANGVRGEVDLGELARPACQQLSADIEEAVNVAVYQDGDVVSIEQVNLSNSLVTVDWVGERHPLHATASGKVFLAFGARELLDRHLRRPLVSATPRTITDPDRLRHHLDEARRKGYAWTIGELELGLNAAAAPVRRSDGSVAAAIVTSGPEYRVTDARLPEIGAAVQAAAATVSRRLGWLGDATDDG